MADTVRHTLSSLAKPSGSQWKHPGDTGIMEAFISQMEGVSPRPEEERSKWNTYQPHLLNAADDFGDEQGLWLYFNNYFTHWHPLFPFLDGASLRDAFTRCCVNARNGVEVFEGMEADDALVLSVMLEAVFQIGKRGSNQGAPAKTRLDGVSRTIITSLILASCETSSLDYISAIRALFAIELSLWFSRSFRAASHLSGTISSKSTINIYDDSTVVDVICRISI